MTARLSMAIRIGDAARGVFNKTKRIPSTSLELDAEHDRSEHIGVEPMLLALSMELALKAWFVFDFDNPDFVKTHDLVVLFDHLSPESQSKLDAEFKTSVAPFHPSLTYMGSGLRSMLFQHKDAFVDWRYMHEPGRTMQFAQTGFEATLEMVLREFRKRYRVVRLSGPVTSQ